MARRKSLHRRLSRYSRNSTGSAFLDPDTENLGVEQPYWWKNLENNTVMRPSMSSNAANQTSTILDPNSRIDSGELQDEWWKVLETTDIADDAKLTMPTRKPDADSNTVTTLESDEEPGIIKRKVTLRSAARKSRGNPFVNISESETSDEKSTESSPMNKSRSIDKGTTSSKRANKISESSSGPSHSTDVVLKSKPTLFKRRHKDRQRNVFDDVLKENELPTPKKRKSFNLSSHSKTGTLIENKIPAITESPIVKQGGMRQLVLSFENDHDLSRLPNPEAQSTLLESSSSTLGSNKDSNNSKMETRVLKPKSTFLKRRKRGADKNVFADLFAEEETHKEVEISKWKEEGIDADAEASKTCSVGQAGGSFQGSQSTPSNVVNKSRSGGVKATKGSRSTEAITSSAQDPRGSLESNALAQASIASSDTTDKSQDHNNFLKPRSTFLKRSRKRPERNIFQEILEGDDNDDALRRSRSNTLVDRTKEDVMMTNQATVARETRRGIIDQGSNTGSEELHLELSGSSEEDGNNAKETSELYRNTYSDIEISEVGSEPKEKRHRRRALHVSPEIPEMSSRRTACLPRPINEVNRSAGGGTWNVTHREAASDVDVYVTSKQEEGSHTKSHSSNQHERNVLEENKGSSHKLDTQLSIDISDDSDQESKVIERTRRKGTSKLGKPSFRSTVDDSEPDDLQSTSSRPSKKLRTSIRQSTVITHRDTDPEPVLSTPKRYSKSLSKSQKLLSSRAISEAEAKQLQTPPKSQSRNSSMSQKLSSSRVISGAKVEDVEATAKSQSRNSSMSQKLLSSRVISEDEAEDVQAPPKSQSRNSSMSQKLLRSRVMSESEAEDVQVTPKGQSKSLSRSQKLLSSRVISEDETEDVQVTPKGRSKSLSRSQKLLSSRVISEDEAVDVQAPSQRQSRNSSMSQKLLGSRVMSESEAEDVQVTPKGQSKSLSRSQKLLSSRVISEDEAEDVQATPKGQSRNSSRSQKLLSSRVMSESEAEDVQVTPKGQSKSLSRSQKLLSSRVISEDEAVDVQAPSQRQSRNSSMSQKLLGSRVMSESEAEDVQATPKGQSRNSSMSQKLLSSRVLSEDEPEDIQSTRKTGESKSVGKAQKRSTSNAKKEFEAADPKTPTGRSKVLSKFPNDSCVANQIEPCEIDGGAKRQSKSISRVERQSTIRIANVSETKEVEISQQNHSRNFMSREPFVSPTRGESQLTVPISSESNTHRVQEEEEGGIDAAAEIFSPTCRSEQRIAFNPNVPKDREDANLLNANSKKAKKAKEVSQNDTGRSVGKNRSERIALAKAKGLVGSTRTSTNPGKDSSRSQRNIEDFLIPASQVFADKEKMEKLTRELEKIKKQAMDDMKLSANSCKGKLPLQQKKPSNLMKTAKATQKQRPAKPIDKAFLVNGEVYKVPRLPRPKYWVTDRLYKYLWKQLEPKYTLQTRVISEKFVKQLSNVTSFILKQKSYTSYRAELYALMKEMARLGIISTRFEFYNFCREFFPYALRIKMVPMLLPENKRNIPYEKDKLNEPLLRS